VEEYMALSEWQIADRMQVWRRKTFYREVFTVIFVQRNWHFYFWRIFFILFILSLMLFPVFGFGENSLDSSMGYIATLLLASVAYLYVISSSLPAVKYLTLMDQYLFSVFAWIAVIAAQMMIIDWAPSATLVCVLVDVALWILVHAYFVWQALRWHGSEREKIHTVESDLYELISVTVQGLVPKFVRLCS
jgi:hypothetical protein